jgi:hypothetical protein
MNIGAQSKNNNSILAYLCPFKLAESKALCYEGTQ